MMGFLWQQVQTFLNRKVEPAQLQELKIELLEESTADSSYLILIIGSCAIATLGLLSNSAAVIIGAMLIAPLMSPIRGIALGALEGSPELFRRGFLSVILGTLIATTLACFLGVLVSLPTYGSEILARSQPNILDLGIAIAAGGISGYARVRPKISDTLAGTAIAVALMPPVCVIGLGLAQLNLPLSQGATLLYLTNLLGITLSCMLAFWLTGYTPLAQAKQGLAWTLALTGVLLIPLSYSFAELARQARLEASLKQALLNRTITFQKLELVHLETNWLHQPPEVRLTVRAKQRVTPKQVQLLEEFVAKAMKQPFKLIFEVSQVEEITRESDPEALNSQNP
ncbi:hypothetical protein DO97_16775 [Neosynechococcus sphagnicola sy1]|uniref:TIGR00341 family protein n=1 Tax=Neosynechococcus sphagnicola sy1 TaxID=1497020 RepID=A0A098TMV6_9CYAN|nr:DUF389 domain-containing protein [Neosynechococcus sphagnicola]KGF73624.1 hypothetical protein DO97_16775 [Neosynechococcus sphagnicola sy1]